MSFLIDPPLLVASGFAIERALGDDPPAARGAGVATVALFVGVSGALYAGAPGLRPIWGPFGSTSGRDFMLNSGVTRFRHRGRVTDALAVGVLATYPLWLAAGRRLGRRTRRRAPTSAPGPDR